MRIAHGHSLRYTTDTLWSQPVSSTATARRPTYGRTYYGYTYYCVRAQATNVPTRLSFAHRDYERGSGGGGGGGGGGGRAVARAADPAAEEQLGFFIHWVKGQCCNMAKMPALAVPQLAPCASSARAWRPPAVHHSQSE